MGIWQMPQFCFANLTPNLAGVRSAALNHCQAPACKERVWAPRTKQVSLTHCVSGQKVILAVFHCKTPQHERWFPLAAYIILVFTQGVKTPRFIHHRC